MSATKVELLRGDTLEETYVGVGEKGEESFAPNGMTIYILRAYYSDSEYK